MTMMIEKIDLLVSFRAGGKSLLGKILNTAIDTPHVRFVDMSNAIKHFLAQPDSKLGTALKPHQPIMDAGGIIPDGKLIFEVGIAYVVHLDANEGRKTRHLILAGGGRTLDELGAWEASTRSLKIKRITGDYNDMITGVRRRAKEGGVLRVDSSSEEKLLRGWNDYNQFTLPAIESQPAACITNIGFNLPMRTKVTIAINGLDVLAQRKKQLIRRISARSHDAWKMIERCDHPEWFERSTHQSAADHEALAVHATTAFA